MSVTLEETIKRRLQAVPESPGVYLFRDAKTNVIYVGKALRLRDRLRSYFTPGYAQTARVAELIHRATDFEFVTTANEVEALVLENNLIKNYRPRFNIRLKDDKNYLYLKLPVTEEFPRVHYSRRDRQVDPPAAPVPHLLGRDLQAGQGVPRLPHQALPGAV